MQEEYGRTDKLKQEIRELKSELSRINRMLETRDNIIKRLKESKHYQNKMHDIRVICKNPKLECCNVCCEKVNNIYDTTLK